jgi:hypothetical protein
LRLTNKHNLPETFVNILRRPTYTKGGSNISATELINSPRIVQLKRLNEEHLEEDVADRIWAIFGTAIHAVLEHGKDHNHLVEERLHAVLDGWSISGAIDLQIVNDGGIHVSDYKTVSVWSVMNEKIEWEQQLNIYAWLVETVKKVPVTGLSIVAIIRDWNRRESLLKEEYPNAPVKEIPITVWSYEQRTQFIQSRLDKHSVALLAAETKEDLPICTPADMWEKQTSYAIKKIGNKRATAVVETRDEADVKLAELGKGYAIEVRLGERTRCTHYCQVNKFCSQYEAYLQGYEE